MHIIKLRAIEISKKKIVAPPLKKATTKKAPKEPKTPKVKAVKATKK